MKNLVLILSGLLPDLEEGGFSPEEIDLLLIHNPGLAFVVR